MLISKWNSSKFFDKYKSVINDDQSDKLENVSLGLALFVRFPPEEIKELDRKLKELKDFNDRLANTAAGNNDGIALEKEGKIEEAIKVYEASVAEGYVATHSYTRLMVIYSRQKRVEEEIRVIKRAIEVFSTENKRRFKCALKNPENTAFRDILEEGLANCEDVRGLNGTYIYCPYPVKKWQERLDKIYKKQKIH